MTFTQMEYFLAVAKCLSISDAAKRLYLTQPTLSRQISAMEGELNLPLFYRGKKGLSLTPAGQQLAFRFETILSDYRDAVVQAKAANLGIAGELNIGILDGHVLGSFFPAFLAYFQEHYPNIQVNVQRRSFGTLANGLYDRTLHFAFSMSFDMPGRPGLRWMPLEEASNDLVLPISHPKASSGNLSLADFREELFLINSPDDSPAALTALEASCRQAGFVPKCKMAPSLTQMMLWVEAGYGITVLSEKNILFENPNLRFLSLPELRPSHIIWAWNAEITDPNVSIALEAAKRLWHTEPVE